MRRVAVGYSNMWGASAGFQANYLLECFPCLRGSVEFELSSRPELGCYSVYGYIENPFPGARRIVLSGEPGDHFAQGGKIAADGDGGIHCQPGFFHYGITCAAEQDHPNHLYLPQGFLHLNLYNQGVQTLVRDGSPAPAKEFFANFIYSNGCSPDRIRFYEKLSKVRRVESCGAVLRNNNALAGAAYSRQGYLEKQAFQARCKFSIAMENTYFPGYCTEKLTDALVARSVPIYRGDPRVGLVFNPEAMINLADFASDEEAIEYLEVVDRDDALYQSYLDAPPFVGNVIPERFTDRAMLAFWERVLA